MRWINEEYFYVMRQTRRSKKRDLVSLDSIVDIIPKTLWPVVVAYSKLKIIGLDKCQSSLWGLFPTPLWSFRSTTWSKVQTKHTTVTNTQKLVENDLTSHSVGTKQPSSKSSMQTSLLYRNTIGRWPKPTSKTWSRSDGLSTSAAVVFFGQSVSLCLFLSTVSLDLEMRFPMSWMLCEELIRSPTLRHG